MIEWRERVRVVFEAVLFETGGRREKKKREAIESQETGSLQE
jgi:hypothetical protein